MPTTGRRKVPPLGRRTGGFSPCCHLFPPLGREFAGFSPVYSVFLPFGRGFGDFSPAVPHSEPPNGQGAEKQATPCPLTCPRMLSKALYRARSPAKKDTLPTTIGQSRFLPHISKRLRSCPERCGTVPNRQTPGRSPERRGKPGEAREARGDAGSPERRGKPGEAREARERRGKPGRGEGDAG